MSFDPLLQREHEGDSYRQASDVIQPNGAENHPNFLSQAVGSAEPIAIIAKKKLETGQDFLPEDANPVYLKTPDYKKS